jgi:ribulose kinase
MCTLIYCLALPLAGTGNPQLRDALVILDQFNSNRTKFLDHKAEGGELQ